ncbi:hypothetical protein, partial [Clostridium tetanomorphum]|uniref:hypothetical protein n=1 Tax=Clostridium tetanomorphum TaxID=1553 RepID=UPI001A9ABFB9
DFAFGFLQILPHGGHPCRQLVVPTTEPTTDFHRQVVAHAGHTIKPPYRILYSIGGFIQKLMYILKYFLDINH